MSDSHPASDTTRVYPKVKPRVVPDQMRARTRAIETWAAQQRVDLTDSRKRWKSGGYCDCGVLNVHPEEEFGPVRDSARSPD